MNRRRIFVTVAAVTVLAAIQAAIFVGLRWVSRENDDDRSLRNVEALAVPLPLGALPVDVRGTSRTVPSTARPHLVHVWATWCKPCREELPALLRVAPELEQHGISVVLLSVDEAWPVIDHYFDGATPTSVVRMSHDDARNALGVAAMPTTVLLDSAGRVTHRLAGMQPWSSPKARDELLLLTSR